VPRIHPAVVSELIALGRFAAERDWVPATSGNFSCRLDAEHVAITRSGVDKGTLKPADLAVVSLTEPLPSDVSAETPLHLARYRSDFSVGAVVHIHSVAATVLSRAHEAQGAIELEGFEMQKALAGVTTHESTVRLPIFGNAQDTAALADAIEGRLSPGVPGYLLAGHGLYAWGETMQLARRHVEGLEFLLRCTLEERRVR
jgi:methylthioribulose-1-phosphate dehydratase